MTKRKLLFLTVLGLVTISGCAAPSATPESTTIESTISSSVSQQVATITLKIDGEEIETKEVTFDEGDVLYDIMAANFTIEANDGFITSIDGHKQDEAAGKYWMYDINDEMALKGAQELTIKSGDAVLFKLEEMK